MMRIRVCIGLQIDYLDHHCVNPKGGQTLHATDQLFVSLDDFVTWSVPRTPDVEEEAMRTAKIRPISVLAILASTEPDNSCYFRTETADTLFVLDSPAIAYILDADMRVGDCNGGAGFLF